MSEIDRAILELLDTYIYVQKDINGEIKTVASVIDLVGMGKSPEYTIIFNKLGCQWMTLVQPPFPSKLLSPETPLQRTLAIALIKARAETLRASEGDCLGPPKKPSWWRFMTGLRERIQNWNK